MKLPKSFIEKFKHGPKEVDRLVYVRGANRKRIGVVIVHNGNCGWSLCKDIDSWDTREGLSYAYGRVMAGNKNLKDRIIESLLLISSPRDISKNHHKKMLLLHNTLVDILRRDLFFANKDKQKV